MFVEVEHYPFLQRIVAGAGDVCAEVAVALAASSAVSSVLGARMTLDYPSNQWTWDNGINTAAIGYDLREGSYSMLTLCKPGHVLADVERHFPRTLALLAGVPGLHFAAFSALEPGAHLGLHAHSRRHLIFHMLLNDLEGGDCEIICDGHVKRLARAGDTALFDYSLPHETFSHAGNVRINLMVDFTP